MEMCQHVGFRLLASVDDDALTNVEGLEEPIRLGRVNNQAVPIDVRLSFFVRTPRRVVGWSHVYYLRSETAMGMALRPIRRVPKPWTWTESRSRQRGTRSTGIFLFFAPDTVMPTPRRDV
jgi:hypothetical protein